MTKGITNEEKMEMLHNLTANKKSVSQALINIRAKSIGQVIEINNAPTYGVDYGHVERRVVTKHLSTLEYRDKIIFRKLIMDSGVSRPTITVWEKKYKGDTYTKG